MSEIQTTVPVKPTGITPTEVPMGITGTLTNQPISGSTLMVDQPLYDPTSWIYIDSFSVGVNSGNSLLYTWNCYNPLSSAYSLTNDERDRTKYVVPWSLVMPSFSRTSRVSWEIMFKPIKINDSRVQLDIIHYYGNEHIAQKLTSDLFTRDMFHFNVDDPNVPIQFTPNMYWMQRTVNTKIGHFNDQKMPVTQSTLPQTKIGVYARTGYVPNLMQLDNFQMMVFVRPIVSGMSGFTAFARTGPGRVAVPYWTSIVKVAPTGLEDIITLRDIVRLFEKTKKNTPQRAALKEKYPEMQKYIDSWRLSFKFDQ